MTYLARLATLIVLTLTTVVVVGCGDDGGDGGETEPMDDGSPVRLLSTLDSPASLRIILSPSEGEDEFEITGSSAAISASSAVPPGIYNVVVFDAGSGDVLSLNAPPVNITEAASTLAIYADQDGSPRLAHLTEPVGVPSENSGSLRFANLTSSSGGADIFNLADGSRLVTVNRAAVSSYEEFPGGFLGVEVKAQGLTTVLGTIDEIRVAPGEVSTIYFFGNMDPNGDGLLDDAQLESLQVLDAKY